MPNRTDNFLEKSGQKEFVITDVQFEASVVIQEGTAIYRKNDSTGRHTASTNATGNFVGVLKQEIAATDDDFATDLKIKQIVVPRGLRAEFEFTVGTGTLTTALIGDSVKLNADGRRVDVETAGTQFVITGVISTTRGTGYFNQAIS